MRRFDYEDECACAQLQLHLEIIIVSKFNRKLWPASCLPACVRLLQISIFQLNFDSALLSCVRFRSPNAVGAEELDKSSNKLT